MKREEAETLLEPREDGLFLVRESNNYPGDYTLCVCADGKVEHYHIIYKDNKLSIDEEEFFENLNQLVEVLFWQNQGIGSGACFALTHCCLCQRMKAPP